MFQILQFLCDEPLAVHQGLLADIGLRHQLLKSVGDLDIIAEHLVVADLQRADAGFLLFLGLHLSDDTLAAFQDMPQAVYLLIAAVPDNAALPDGKRRLVADRGGDVAADVIQRVHGLRQLGQAAVGKGRKLLLQIRQLFNSSPEGYHVPPAGGAVDNAADKPLHVAKARHTGDELLPADGIVYQRRHGAAAAVNIRHGQEGPLQPAPQHSGAHGRFRLVQHPEKAALFLLAP